MARRTLRIIGGEWRGRRFAVPMARDLRPTGDRIRETLFNWLIDELEGRRVLDLFAGSGALGLEALSRGAAKVVFVDDSTVATAHLRATLADLGVDDARAGVVRADARGYLRQAATPFDIVFLDPPFRSTILDAVCAGLEDGGWLAPRAHVYIERDWHAAAPVLPATWSVARDKRAGSVEYWLIYRKGA